MKKLRFSAFFLCLLLLFLTGCSAPDFLSSLLSRSDAAQPETMTVYRILSGPAAGEDLIQPELYPLPEGDLRETETALMLFAQPCRTEHLSCALPEGVAIDGWTLDNGVVTLNFSPDYLLLDSMDQTVTAFCAALTLCQLDEVEAVTILSGGQTVFSGLVPEDALLRDTDTDPYVRQLRLYFADSSNRYLVSEYHSLTLDEETSAERYVIEELLRGPNNSELHSALPAGTALRSCSTDENGVCTVDLSAAFLDERPRTALGERLAVYSIVDSLTALSSVNSVVFLVEGQPLDTYVHTSLAGPLTRYDEPIGPVSTAKGEIDADLYLVTPERDGIAPLPCRVRLTDYESRAEAVLSALLSASEPGYPSVFPGSGTVIGLSLSGSFCTVDISESFFASLNPEDRTIAVESIAATLCALPEIAAVTFTVGGSPAVFDSVDYSGPWYDFFGIEEN